MGKPGQHNATAEKKKLKFRKRKQAKYTGHIPAAKAGSNEATPTVVFRLVAVGLRVRFPDL